MSSTAPSAEMEFVVFYEKNRKENEVFVFYLQWTGNEAEITKLNAIMSKALYDDMYGDYSQVHLDLNVKLPESHVDSHCKLSDMNGYHRMFTKCVGKFTCPFTADDEALDEYETAKCLDETFYSCRIRTMFV